MFSDDDKPLRAKASSGHVNGSNGHVVTNGNGRRDESSSLSEDDEVPLVSCSFLYY